ncbi:MAG: glycosyltransferase [Pseudarcicella sp.]|nr:glycosyltransferase [Pseudarcicella sp.]MBP6411622.1 glycosyltransferase [Pseudarcicella sp.]
MTKKKLLFFTPLAGRTGSEMMLLYFFRYFDRQKFQVFLVSFQHGELLKELPSDVQYFVIEKKYSLSEKILFKLGTDAKQLAISKIQKKVNADIWYMNTITLPEILPLATKFGVKLITHFHELPQSYAAIKYADLQAIITQSNLLIGCASATTESICNAGAQNAKNLHSFIDTNNIVSDEVRKTQLKQQLNIQQHQKVLVMSGTTDPRKGFDFLPEIAQLLNNKDIHLIWLGKKIDSGFTYFVENYCKNIHSETQVHILGAQKEDYYNYLAIADLFLLTSREDPFPLVMIEAAFLGKPIIAFDSGGASEFITPAVGHVVQNFDLPDFCNKIKETLQTQQLFSPIASKNRALDFAVDKQVATWQELISSVIE